LANLKKEAPYGFSAAAVVETNRGVSSRLETPDLQNAWDGSPPTVVSYLEADATSEWHAVGLFP